MLFAAFCLADGVLGREVEHLPTGARRRLGVAVEGEDQPGQLALAGAHPLERLALQHPAWLRLECQDGVPGVELGEAGFRGYVLGVARNLLLAYFRRKRKQAERFDPLEHSVADQQTSFTTEMARRRELAQAARLITHGAIHERGRREGEEHGIRVGEERGIRVGEERGIRVGEERGLRAAIRGLCAAFGIPLDDAREAALEAMDAAELGAFVERLGAARAWP